MVNFVTKEYKLGDEPVPGHSSLGTSHLCEYEPLEVQAKLLNAALHSLRTPEDWQYMGRHALPVCFPAFMAVIQRLMLGSSKSAGLQDVEIKKDIISMMRPFFTILRALAENPFPAQVHRELSFKGGVAGLLDEYLLACMLCADCALSMYVSAS